MKAKKSLAKGWIVMGIGVTAIIGGLGFYKFSEIKTAIEVAESFPEHYEVVESMHVEPAEHLPVVSVLGEVASPLHVDLSVEMAGKVNLVKFKSGQYVEQGDVIFQLDVKEELAKLRSATAREKHANSVYQRYKTLLAKKSVSQELYDQAYSDLIVIQSEIEVLNTTIARKTARAPFSGTLGIHDVSKGDYIQANQTLVNFVGESEELWIDFRVPQFYPRLGKGDLIQVSRFEGVGKSVFSTAEVIARDSQVSDSSRSLKYRAVIKKNLSAFSPNTPVAVMVPVSEKQILVQVPVSSVNQGSYGAFVMKLKEQEGNKGNYRAEPAPVNVVAEKDGYKFISHGISVGDQIASSGSFKLYPGILVKVKPSTTQPLERLDIAGN